MFRISFFSPEAKAKRLIQKHLSRRARQDLRRGIFFGIVLFIFYAIVLNSIRTALNNDSTNPTSLLASCACAALITIIVAICTILYIITVCKDFKALRTATANWTQYQYLLTDNTNASLNALIRTTKTRIDEQQRTLSSLKAEQRQLENDYHDNLAEIQQQIEATEKIISDTDLEGLQAMLEDLLALRESTH